MWKNTSFHLLLAQLRERGARVRADARSAQCAAAAGARELVARRAVLMLVLVRVLVRLLVLLLLLRLVVVVVLLCENIRKFVYK